jgi:hypothetical protein
MANNRKTTPGRKHNEGYERFEGTLVKVREQVVMSEPQYIFKERYITERMLERASKEGLTKKQALAKFGKNRYAFNPNAKPLKTIIHYV